MKAAVIYPSDHLPIYSDMPIPAPQEPGQLLVRVRAVALKHVDKTRAEGRHYSSETERGDTGGEGRIPGGDGVCILPDGSRVYAIGVSGMLAEQAIIEKDRMVAIPDNLDDLTAAALPNAVIGAAMGLRFKAAIQPGDVVLVNGATGFTGRVAVQIAKHYGASKVIVTGRNRRALEELMALGADEAVWIGADRGSVGTDGEGVSVGTNDDATGMSAFKERLGAIHRATPIDIVIDYLWGRTAEIILGCLKGKGHFTNRIRYVSVGSMAGDLISLSAANLRSVDLQLSGSGLGAWTRQQVGLLFREILPEMFALAAAGQLRVKTVGVPLDEIGQLWNLAVMDGARPVVTI